MTLLTLCPCCSNNLLHHIGNHRDYWFCRTCWQEMPNLETTVEAKNSHRQNRIINLSIGLEKFKNSVLA
jgi:hypothetical protein